MTQPSPSTPSESSDFLEYQVLGAISDVIWDAEKHTVVEADEIAEEVLNLLRSKGLIYNG